MPVSYCVTKVIKFLIELISSPQVMENIKRKNVFDAKVEKWAKYKETSISSLAQSIILYATSKDQIIETK